MLTEEEAKTKWCPFARSGNEAGCNRNGENGFAVAPHCIGSGCMAWRPVMHRETLRNYHDDLQVQVNFKAGDRDYPDGWQYGHTDKDRDGRKFDQLHRLTSKVGGYCGLAGAP